MAISVALLEIQNPGNLGAIARVMENFDLKELILINPKCKINKEALDRASHAKDILKKAKIKSFNYLKKFDYIVGTTAITGTDYNLLRSTITPEKTPTKNKTVILFGREDSGLNNKELERCDLVIKIPASKKYPTLNISHAASIIFYEIFKKKKNIKLATKKDKDVLLNLIYKTLDKLEFKTKHKKLTQKRSWKNTINKSFLTKRELYNLCGYFRKIEKSKEKRV